MKKKIGVMLYMFFCTITILCRETYAYLDPSSMTYLIQITAAIFITIGTTFGILIYKIKRFFKNRLKKDSNNIDENTVKNTTEIK